MSRYAFALVACLALVASAADAADRRIALVIGNSAYKHEPLVNPGNDARLMAQALRDSGFTVTELRNLNQTTMRRAIREFGDELAKGGIGLFYYSGHGMQYRGKNYLVPVGNDIQREDEIADQSVDVTLLLEKMRTASNALNILILDACRNNPFGTVGPASAGLAPMDAPARTIIAFSTAPGQFAADGSGDNSVYTKNLVTYMREPGMKLEDVFKRVRTAVRQDSGGRQVPWENTSLESDFYFKAPDAKAIAGEQEERRKEQQAAIDRAVEAALKRRESSAPDRASIEREIAARVAAERAAAERAAAERIAAVEKETQAVIERAMQRMQSTAARPGAEPASASAKSASTARPVEPAKVASIAPASVSGGILSSPLRRSVGDTWTYRFTERDYGNSKQSSFSRTVEAVSDTEVSERSGAGVLHVYKPEGNPLRVQLKSGEVRSYDPHVPLYHYPLEPGKTWSQKFIHKRPDREIENDATGTIVGWEHVTVGAGTFKALKMNYVAWYRRRDNNFTGRVAINVWFAPEVKRWVKMEYIDRGNNGVIYADTSEELISYRVK